MTQKENDLEVLPGRIKFANLMVWLFFGLSLFLVACVFWRSEIYYGGILRGAYFYFYLLSLSATLFWGVALRLKSEIQLNLVMSSISLIAGLYIVEIYLAFIETYAALPTAAKKAGVSFDTRTKMEVIRDLKEEGVDAVPVSCGHKLFEVEEADGFWFTPGGISKKTTVGANENGYFQIIHTDRYGFNNPDSVWDTEKTDWLLIGDSFTFGAAVQPGEEISSQIRNFTHSSTVINLGCAQNGPLEQLLSLKEYAETKVPKRVLWMYYEGNDLHDLNRSSKSQQIMNYLRPGFSQNLIQRQEEIDAWKAREIIKAETRYAIKWKENNRQQAQEWKDEEQLLILRLFHLRNAIGFNPAQLTKDADHIDINPLLLEILTITRDRVAEWGGKLYFVYLPEYNRYKRYFSNHSSFRNRSELLKLVDSIDIPIIDIHKAFMNHPEPLSLFPFRHGGHYNAQGYRLTARTIVKKVEKIQQTLSDSEMK